MQLVASSKLRNATIRAENTSHFSKGSAKALEVVPADKEGSRNNLLITVVSDKGM